MIRSFLFLSYLTCVVFAIVYSIKQTPVTTMTASSYTSKKEANDVRSVLKQDKHQEDNGEPVIYTENNTQDVPVTDGNNVDGPYDNIINVPLSQRTEGYSPNTLKEIPMADPAENISLINAPVANSSGNAALVFNMKLPDGRMGIQPNLSIQYNNEGGNSWLGTGWSMSLPSISIETRWGAPRYDAALESEIYSFNGEELAPLTNRSEFVARSVDKRFYQRAEGSFNKIIRHGSSPTNYWWEVTEKNGTRNFYGGKPGTGVDNAAVLKDDANNIGYWALVETRDLNNNFVRYVYATVSDPGIENGSVPGKQLYLSQVLYTGNGTTDGPYKIQFTRDRQKNETKRKDVSIDARLGFKMVTADLLRQVDITLNNEPIRSYVYQYEEGAFYKTLLKSITEQDAIGLSFYTQHFEYYDDVNKAAGYNAASGATEWSIANDGVKGTIWNPTQEFSSEGSAISTSGALSRSGGIAVTIGSLFGDTWSKRFTVGGSFNYGQDEQEGLLSLTDINGDGLPDKVFKQDNKLVYRANLGAATHSFGPQRPIIGVSDFSTSVTENIGGGVQVIPPSGFFGYNHTTSVNISKVFFSDFNGDGLMDIADGGRVYFNHLNANGDPEFGTNSGVTPSPIFDGKVDASLFAPDTALQGQQERDFPLQDIIRMWKAPFTGTVNITAPVQLQNVPNTTGVPNHKKDGVRVSIQTANVILWSTVIDSSDYTVKTPANVTGVGVTKGQCIYFRVQSRYNGEYDLVSWDPAIQYSTPVVIQSDVHHKVSTYYKASEDFILHSRAASGMGKDGAIVIDGTFRKEITSDSVWIVIGMTRDSFPSILFQRGYAGKELANGAWQIPGQINVQENDQIYFTLFSKSYIDRSAIEWNPHYEYIVFNDGSPVTSTSGLPTMQDYPVPDNSNYNQWRVSVPPVVLAKQDTVIIWPQVIGNGNATGTVWFSIKGPDTIYARRSITMTNGAMNLAMDSIHLIRKANEPVFLEYAVSDPELAGNLQNPVVEVYRDSIGVADTTRIGSIVDANFYSNYLGEYLGPLFRGWGQFILKGDKGDGIIDEATLNLDELQGYPTDPALFTDSAAMGNVQDPSKTNFVMMFPDARKKLWQAYDSSVYVTNTLMSSSRLYLHDVSVDSLMSGGAARTGFKASTTHTNSVSAGVTPGFSGSAGTSFASTVVDQDIMDMNGDRYPDVVNKETIQYTLPHGGLGTMKLNQSFGETLSEGWAAGLTLGGNFIEASTENNTRKAAMHAQKTAKNSAGLSGSINVNDDAAVRSWIDVNGDGLLDRVYDNGTVALNFGYRFADPEQWGAGGIDRNRSYSGGAGLGVNLDQGSFEAGFGLSKTVGDNGFLLTDVNGDGLPDDLRTSSDGLVVRLNTGNSFGPAFIWNAFDSLTSIVSVGEAINGAFTIPIPIIIPPFVFLKICVNPSVNIGHGVSTQEATLMDIDGDGYPDMLHSSNDGHLTATTSTIGRTNMLRKVKSPLGGYFSMDYERIGNTYEMPQSKWVLKSVEVFDGVPGDGIDTTRQRFSYEGGHQDRHEREFYGFKKVITRDLNTANNNIVYRSRIQEFLNTNYYNKGLLKGEWVEDATGKKFNQTIDSFEIRDVQDSVKFAALKQTERLFYEGIATAGVRTVKQFEYDAIGNVTRISDAGDGSQQDMTITDITYHNNDNLYLKSIPSTVTITTAEGVKRKTITTINGTGNMTQIRRLLADNTAINTDMEYDSYGNMTKITRPANYKGERMWYSYEYDNVVHNYITKVTDAFGYTSTTTFDYKYGAITRTVSRNNEEVRYTLDARGRVSTVTGPVELAAGKPYSISFLYNPSAPTAFAITRRYDPEHNGDILTLNFADGLGRSVQVKKQVSLFKGKGVADEKKMVVSGSDLFDPYGRIENSYYPIIEPIGVNLFLLNTGTGDFKIKTTYDVEDRTVKTELADGATTTMVHTGVSGFFIEAITDPLNSRTDILTDVRGRKRTVKEYGPNGIITTRFDYNALSEMVKMTDTKSNTFTATYDNIGRKISTNNADGGRIDFIYDPASNLVKKITAQIRKEISNGGAIQYQYDYERLTDIDYPRQYQNKIKYTYGKAGTGVKAGRLILQEDASGGQEFFYGKQGEVVKVIRTVLVNPVFSNTFVSQQEYDTWFRLKKIIYPDGEEVRYHYNEAGNLASMEGTKQGSTYKYVDQLGYDEYEQRTYLRYGNGAETFYKYDNMRRRLTQLQANTATGDSLMNNSYSYDLQSNVLGVVNNVQSKSGSLGGFAKQNYHYDNFYRLDSASGEFKGASENANYGVKVAYDNLHNIVKKTMKDSKGSYDQSYTYDAASMHQATDIGQNKYTYDENGNNLGYGDIENFWDEENRMMAVLNKGVLNLYTYDADGERIIKSSGGLQGIWVNGAPAGAVRHSDNYTIYVSPYLTVSRTSFTKHYYIDNQRVVTKLGHGTFINISFPQPGLTAGNVDYNGRAARMEKARMDYYASLGVSPGPPTDKNYWARPENSGIPAPVFIDTSATMVPPGWPGNTTPPTIGPPIFVDTIPSNDSVKAGYGFNDPGHIYETDQNFYHPDHVGSTAYVTNSLGKASQHIEYSPFGETFFAEHTGSFQTSYLFNSKGRDEETGYYNYGYRYYDPVISQWLSIDPLVDPSDAEYSLMTGVNQDISISGSATMGSTTSSDLVFSDAAAGMSLSGLHGNDDKPTKKDANKSNGTGPKVSKTTVINNKSDTKAQQKNMANVKRGFRQAGNGVQVNGLFFNHLLKTPRIKQLEGKPPLKRR